MDKTDFIFFKNRRLITYFLIGSVSSFIIFGPIISKLRLRLLTNKKLVSEQSKLNTKLSFLEGIDRDLIDKRVKKMEIVFPSKKPVVALMGSLANLSKEYSLSFGGITLRPGVIGEENNKKAVELKDLKFGFKVGGDFDNLTLFMKDLEKMAPLMKINQLGLSIKTNPFFGQESLNVIADIEVLAYYQAPPISLGAVTKPVELLNKKDEVLLNKLFSFKTFEVVIPVAQTGKVDLFSSGLPEPL